MIQLVCGMKRPKLLHQMAKSRINLIRVYPFQVMLPLLAYLMMIDDKGSVYNVF